MQLLSSDSWKIKNKNKINKTITEIIKEDFQQKDRTKQTLLVQTLPAGQGVGPSFLTLGVGVKQNLQKNDVAPKVYQQMLWDAHTSSGLWMSAFFTVMLGNGICYVQSFNNSQHLNYIFLKQISFFSRHIVRGICQDNHSMPAESQSKIKILLWGVPKAWGTVKKCGAVSFNLNSNVMTECSRVLQP